MSRNAIAGPIMTCRTLPTQCQHLPFLGAKARFSRHVSLRPSPLLTRSSSEDMPETLGDDSSDLERQLLAAARVYESIEEYKLLLQQPDENIDLLQGAALIARHRYPLLDYEGVVEQLDDLAVQIEGGLPSGTRYPLRVLQAISTHLYTNRGFRGNTEDYYDPDNSCINRVLERRVGIPITLALVYAQVSARLGLPMLGVNIPGHFFLTPAAEGTEFLVDVFEGGNISFLQDVESTLESIYGRPVRVPPELLQRKQPLPNSTFLARMLNNLKQVYTLRKDYSSAYLISCYLQATRPTDIEVIRDSGVFLYYLKRYPECIQMLHRYLELAPQDSEDAAKIRRLLDSLVSDQ